LEGSAESSDFSLDVQIDSTASNLGNFVWPEISRRIDSVTRLVEYNLFKFKSGGNTAFLT
jgi:hypothetical protein